MKRLILITLMLSAATTSNAESKSTEYKFQVARLMMDLDEHNNTTGKNDTEFCFNMFDINFVKTYTDATRTKTNAYAKKVLGNLDCQETTDAENPGFHTLLLGFQSDDTCTYNDKKIRIRLKNDLPNCIRKED